MNFGPVTPELTELICERLVRQGQKTGVFSRISPGYTGPIFAIFSPYESDLGVNDGSISLFSDLSRDVAMATK